MPGKVRAHYLDSNDAAREAFFKTNQIYVNVWNKLLRRDFVVENEILCKEGLLYEDHLWEFYLLKHLSRAAFCQDVTYHQWKRLQSITTGLGEKVRVESLAIIYREVLESLTPGHEREEYFFYARKVAKVYIRYGRIVPESRQTLIVYIEKCSRLGDGFLYLKLILCYVLGRFRILTVLAQIKQFCHHLIFRS